MLKNSTLRNLQYISMKYISIFQQTESKTTFDKEVDRLNMSKQKIQTRYKIIRSREQESLFQALMNDQTNICKDFMINLNTDTNLTIHTLKKKFRLLNAIVNRKLFKNYQKCPDKRVSFIGFFERELNNNHINLLLKIPKEYDVLKVLVLINQGWKKLGFRPHFEVSKNKRAVVSYQIKQFTNQGSENFLYE